MIFIFSIKFTVVVGGGGNSGGLGPIGPVGPAQ